MNKYGLITDETLIYSRYKSFAIRTGHPDAILVFRMDKLDSISDLRFKLVKIIHIEYDKIIPDLQLAIVETVKPIDKELYKFIIEVDGMVFCELIDNKYIAASTGFGQIIISLDGNIISWNIEV